MEKRKKYMIHEALEGEGELHKMKGMTKKS